MRSLVLSDIHANSDASCVELHRVDLTQEKITAPGLTEALARLLGVGTKGPESRVIMGQSLAERRISRSGCDKETTTLEARRRAFLSIRALLTTLELGRISIGSRA